VARELTELEPGNTTYRRDLSVSYDKLADLALAAGRSGDAEALYRQSLAGRQELTELEPGNTTYRRDLSVSYERLGKVAVESGLAEEARRCLTIALDMRQELHQQEPHRADLAEELGVILYLFAGAVGEQADVRQEIIEILAPFEQVGTITRQGVSLLGWARQPTTE
jgi:tetratricopeptide (TPR) repeat protein